MQHTHKPWTLKQHSPCEHLALMDPKKRETGNDHLHLCQTVKSNSRRQNERCQALTWRATLRTHAKLCQELILLPVLQLHHGVPSCFYFFTLMRRGYDVVSLLIPTKNRPLACVLIGGSAYFPCLDIFQKAICKVSIRPGACKQHFKYKWDMIRLNLDQIPLSLQTWLLEGVDSVLHMMFTLCKI